MNRYLLEQKQSVVMLATVCLMLVCGMTSYANDAQSAEALADTIRKFNDAFADVVEGEMTPAQIEQFERMIAPAFDVEKRHASQCGLVAFISVQKAGLIRMASGSPAMSEMRDELLSEIVIGSLDDWLVQFSQSLLPALGFERTLAATKHECLQKPYAHAMFAEIPMYSQQMIDEERCLLHQDC